MIRESADALPDDVNFSSSHRLLLSLFVIARLNPSADRVDYWACSSEHGCGWSDTPKQSFTASELVREIDRLVRSDAFDNCTIRRLSFYV